ncbi:cytochrome c family protein [uncultured Maricaulis sp.]|uniref:c-type cytochrome n=1 Tax=uncultured Maricaulis sp. TaxID=174710 RepID=UPI0030DB8926|tara:strand:- start:253025 stop:253705 length:681 start_codon:yes stop_codon:yes gene_type:complete
MGDLFFNKIAGVIIGGILAILVITEVGHMLVKSHAPEALTAENTAYPVNWAALESGSATTEQAVVAGPTDYGLLLASADASAGERVARRCQSCHNFENGGANGTGPHLWDVVGRQIASVPDFNYSDALHALGGAWDYARLNAFLESPARYAPGTAMTFAGLRDEGQRMDLIAYLRSLSEAPVALPDPLPVQTAAAVDTAVTDAAAATDIPATQDATAPAEVPGEGH